MLRNPLVRFPQIQMNADLPPQRCGNAALSTEHVPEASALSTVRKHLSQLCSFFAIRMFDYYSQNGEPYLIDEVYPSDVLEDHKFDWKDDLATDEYVAENMHYGCPWG